MKKTLSILLLSILTLSYTQAQKLENSLLWKVSGNDLKEASYIYGTLHATCDATLSDPIKMALDETSLLVLELDMDDPAMQTKMMGNSAMKDNKTMKDLLSEDDYAILDKFILAQIGAPLSALDTFKPFFLSAMFIPKYLDCTMQSFEGELMKVAKAQEEEIMGLETVEEQMKVFDDIPYEAQLKDLMTSVKDELVKDKEKYKKMLAFYAAQDLGGIAKMTFEDDSVAFSEHLDLILTNRNKNWISKMENFAKEQPTFFGVGAAHLIGDEGVVKLLRARGYTVTAVK